ncbi:unnamed protein product, partial [Discosporangium mesarthrocarpum]
FLRQLVDDGVIELVATPSSAQHADILTKSLGERMFNFHAHTLFNL